MNTTQKAGAIAANPTVFAPMGALGGGGGKHHTEWQSGADQWFQNATPEDIALNLGKQGFGPGYDSNTAGSFQRSYDQLLNNISPDLLVKRYGQGNANQFQATGTDQTNYQAYQTFKSLIGRDPTANEFAQVVPQFMGANGLATGRQYLAAYADQLKNTPSELAKRAPQYADQIHQVFQSNLGRNATADELSHYGGLLAGNQTDAYGINQMLKSSPDYQNIQDTKFQQSIIPETQQYVTDTFNKVSPSIMSQFSQNGISNSSALSFALTNMLGDLARTQSNYVTGVKANQYQGNKDLGVQGGRDAINQYLDNYTNQRSQNQNMLNSTINRGWANQDYQTQMSDYMNYLHQNQRQSNRGANIFGGALAGAGALAPLGPWGAAGGALAGGGFGYLNG